MKFSHFVSLFLVTFPVSCSFAPPAGRAPTRPQDSWQATAQVEKVLAPLGAHDSTPGYDDFVKSLPERVTLSQLLDVALRNSPLTRASWLQTQSSYAEIGAARADYYPQVDVGGGGEQSRRTNKGESGDAATRTVRNKRAGPYAALNYLLYDFGAREARIDERKMALVAANFAHNAAVQKVVLEVQRAFARYVALRFLKRSQETSLKDAEVNLDAALKRQEAGLSTIADVLQARTSLSHQRYVLQSTSGQLQAVRGAVLAAAGLPPSAPLDIAEISTTDLEVKGIDDDVLDLLKRAEAQNPTLAAGRARIAQAQEKERAARAQGYPTVAINSRVDRWYNSDFASNDYSATLSLNFPLFTGFSRSFEVTRAARDAERAEAEYDRLRDEHALAVWSDYYAYKTAAQQIVTGNDLHASATQSYDVALGRYREGVGSILDLLAAQSALENARATRVQAYADWFLSLAQLRFDIGTLAEEPIDTKLEAKGESR